MNEPTAYLPLYGPVGGWWHDCNRGPVAVVGSVEPRAASVVPASRVTIADPEPEVGDLWADGNDARCTVLALPDKNGDYATTWHHDQGDQHSGMTRRDDLTRLLIPASERTPGDERPTPEPADDGPPRVGDTVTATRWVDEDADTMKDVDDPLVATVVAVDEDCACIESDEDGDRGDEGLYLARFSDCTVTKRADR